MTARTSRRCALVCRSALVVTLAALAGGAAGTPAYADSDQMLLSHDGTAWGESLEYPLFDDVPTMVPRDVVGEVFYVKNDTGAPARASFRVIDSFGTTEFERSLDVTLGLGDRKGTTALAGSAGSAGQCDTVTGPVLAPGQIERVRVGLAFRDVVGQAAMVEAADLSFVVRMQGLGPGGGTDTCARDSGSPDACDEQGTVITAGTQSCSAATDALPDTGAPRGLRVLGLLGVVLVGIGLMLVMARRRQDEAEGSTAEPGT